MNLHFLMRSVDTIGVSNFQVVKGSEILEVLHSLTDVKQYLFSLYNCQYKEFFQCLGEHFIKPLLPS